MNQNIIKVKKSVVADGRFYLQDMVLASKTKFKPGTPYQYIVNRAKKLMEIIPHENGDKIVAKRTVKDGEIPIIDIRNSKSRTALEGCDYQVVTIMQDRIIVTGHMLTAEVLRQEALNKNNLFNLRTITFCGGGGISAYHAKQAGFSEDYILEFNPLKGESQWSRYADIAEINHPKSAIINVPIEEFKASMVPDLPAIWFCTVPCNEYSRLNVNAGKEPDSSDDKNHTMHLGLHVIRIFSELPEEKRPECIFFENVPEFGKTTGKALEYFFRDQGYFVTSAVLESADFGSLMRRKRYYMVANVHAPFEFPEPTGKNTVPFINQPWFNLDEIDWHTADDTPSIKYMLDRQAKKGKAVLNIKAIDPLTDCVSYAIPKEYRISKPEGQIKHPYKEDTYAIFPTKYLRKIFSLPENFVLGSSATMERECVGQSVDGVMMKLIFEGLRSFLVEQRQKLLNQGTKLLKLKDIMVQIASRLNQDLSIVSDESASFLRDMYELIVFGNRIPSEAEELKLFGFANSLL